ncbi:Rid family hydrolase [Crossiella sp. CA-258035]|uniref:Rid family hydrolase n=1 Tax=Crossiella sp. CA-258035 TaxID=2981138 RepID=UPI0024BD18CA|nr:Rid family hydrolase [Crossiella sp. CA-258035]WHT16707.1 Rid family hydrolase [Crossiella sp. CA-258035]
MPWEIDYGYVQAVRHGDTIHLSGQLAHRGSEPPSGDMGEQMRQTYANAEELLRRFGSSLADVVEEVLYVLDIPAAMAVAGPVRKAAYGREDPQVASTILGTTGLAFPEQLIEIKFLARV